MPIEMQYLQSLYWSMGLMTGMADGTVPSTPFQYIFTLFCITVGVFTFAYTVGNIGSMDENKMKQALEFQLQVGGGARLHCCSCGDR